MKAPFLYLTLLPSTLLAQSDLTAEPTSAAPPLTAAGAPLGATPLGATPFLTPLRVAPADQGFGGGLWASGAHYKAAFDDGVSFYPVLGSKAPRNLPLRWRTAEISLAQAPLLLAAAERHASEWRYELRHGAIVEAYDVRDDGVEQTFVLRERPKGAGDLVIRGVIDTELVAAATPFRHGSIEFCDADGTPRVCYGAATAIDAVGRRVAMESSYDGRAISLRLSADWLQRATFPVTVDPLLAAINLATEVDALSSVDVARDDGANDLMVVYRRASASTDYDGFGLLVSDTFGGLGTNVFSDLEAAWSAEHLSTAFVGGTNRWILALQRRFPAANNQSLIRYRLHASGNPVPDNTVTHIPAVGSENWVAPDVGGSVAAGTGDHALIVFRAEYPFTAPFNSDVFGMLVNTQTDVYGARFTLASPLSGAMFDRGSVRVNKESGGAASSWVVAFNEINRSQANDDLDVYVARVSATGVVSNRFGLPSPSSDHKVTPSLDGRDGRYMLLYGLRATGHGNPWVHTVRVRRFDFDEASAAPTFGVDNFVALGGELYPTDIAYDSRTRSHWAMTWFDANWDSYAARAGYDAGIGEAFTVHDTSDLGGAPAVCFNDDARHFHVVYPVVGGLSQIRTRTMTYPATSAALQASGCGGTISANDVPWAGSEFFAVRASGLAGNTAAVLLASLSSTNVDLAPFNMPGCSLLVGPNLLFTLNVGADPSGAAAVPLALPTSLAGFDFYFQWAHVAFGSNPANVLATRRLFVPVR